MKKKVLIVEDSILMQRVIGDIIDSSGEFEVCGSARDVVEGWAKFNKLKPDLVTLDYELPGENGLVLLERIMQTNPTPVLMLSAHTKSGAELTIRSLEMGAVDFFTKPSGPISIDLYNYKEELIAKLKAAAVARLTQRLKKKTFRTTEKFKDLYIGIAASTGGVRALNYIIPSLPAKCGLRIIVVQHMPKYFTASLALHLNERSSMVVKEARDGDLILNGEVLIAPGGYHTTVDGEGKRVVLNNDPPRHGVKPSADVLFDSMASAFKNKAIGLVLTGMGHDGAEGVIRIKKQNGIVIAQDPDDAVIGGMPQSAINTNMVDYVLPLKLIPDKIFEFISRR
ncbi:MAG TPA: chemotaxis-specific protein-glutamate methyltransferase CheB [candidate division WOR-3 bacterium]|uniref:Protein-glutamate methylesterase/protein-glutamine glutaminase n=1 Tax=candidate division WOR-3 bacterium TaxID=2052148 RepID=A0A9C9K141_UNCW3|nr:chemotaxis-specific protein-glutamate methyltransferase CheB [candidate division WOR-3 bacterium]